MSDNDIYNMDIMCATDCEEFYYKANQLVVPEGEPIGVDLETGSEVELVLFPNIYWNPTD